MSFILKICRLSLKNQDTQIQLLLILEWRGKSWEYSRKIFLALSTQSWTKKMRKHFLIIIIKYFYSDTYISYTYIAHKKITASLRDCRIFNVIDLGYFNAE